MEEQNKAIGEATEAFRDVCVGFFEFQPLTKLIRATYDEFVNVTLEKIISVPLEFKTPSTVGKIEFKNITRVPPFKGEIVLTAESVRFAKLKTDQQLERKRWMRSNPDRVVIDPLNLGPTGPIEKLPPDTEELFSLRELNERNALLTSIYRERPERTGSWHPNVALIT